MLPLYGELKISIIGLRMKNWFTSYTVQPRSFSSQKEHDRMNQSDCFVPMEENSFSRLFGTIRSRSLERSVFSTNQLASIVDV